MNQGLVATKTGRVETRYEEESLDGPSGVNTKCADLYALYQCHQSPTTTGEAWDNQVIQMTHPLEVIQLPFSTARMLNRKTSLAGTGGDRGEINVK